MPEPLHSPYESGAFTTPRTLQRWLDINAQNGALTRTRKYLSIPSFSITDINWRGYSEIIAEFHVSSPNNFSLRAFTVPLNSTYTLTIAYVINGVTTRYRLWSSADEVIWFDIPEYDGQPINSEFKIEVWSTPVLIITQDTPIRIDTSVQGSVDYRYGTDDLLVLFNNACVGQQYPINPNTNEFDLPFIFNVCGVTGGNVVIGTEVAGGIIGAE